MTRSSRHDSAQALADTLRRKASAIGVVVGDGGFSEDVAQRLVTLFKSAPMPDRPGAAARKGRGDEDYWSDHGELTGKLMAQIALRARAHVDLYRRVGRVHDIDYLAHPHDGKGPGERHPVPLVTAMRDSGIHPAICCAVLEHAPHAGFDQQPSSRLSAALSAAEDLATLAAVDPVSDAVRGLSKQADELFRSALPRRRISGGSLRVEADVDRFINRPLALALDGEFKFEFEFEVEGK